MLTSTIVLSCLALGTVLLVTGCTAPQPVRVQRQDLLGILDHEMHHNQGWVRIHAAEALLDHGQAQLVAPCFEPEAATTIVPGRLGVWRVLWRASTTEPERARFRAAIRQVMCDPQAPDRLAAVESLAKLGLGDEADQATLKQWLEVADNGPAPFLHWLLILSATTTTERAQHQAAVVRLLDAPEEVARLRAGFVLGRLPELSPEAQRRLAQRAEVEPADSTARVYLLEGALCHTAKGSTAEAHLVKQLARYLENGRPNERLEAAVALGRRGSPEAAMALPVLLHSPEGDARIGAASGLLYLQP
jgi:hypothetical protein